MSCPKLWLVSESIEPTRFDGVCGAGCGAAVLWLAGPWAPICVRCSRV